MYRGFNLELKEDDLKFISCSNDKSSGKIKLADCAPERIKDQKTLQNKALNNQLKELGNKTLLRRKIKMYIKLLDQSLGKDNNPEGYLDVSEVLKDWFPEVDAHIFISHSHNDKDLANKLAYCLYDKFGIIAFVDSIFWGCMDDLVDEIYGANGSSTLNNSFDLRKRNKYFSHVHMMLASALATMIDRTECFILLNTPNSVSIKGISEKTFSPWIYHEIAIMNMIEKKPPKRLKKSLLEGENFGYTLDIRDLIPIDKNTLITWCNQKHNKPGEALDWLYNNSMQKSINLKWLSD